MKWLTKIFARDDTEQRLAEAYEQRDAAAKDLQESRELGSRLRKHEQRNGLTERMAAAFAAHERRRHV